MGRRQENDHVLGHQPYDERIKPVVMFAAWLALGTLVVLGAMKFAHGALLRDAQEGSKPLHPLAAEREIPPEPRLQESPTIDLERFREKENERLSTYGWLDRQAGVVRVPIERAMELVAKEGLPVRKESGR